MAVDKETLLKRRFGVETVDVPGLGVVEVRALSRTEALAVQGKELDPADMECLLLSTAMVSPKLTEDEVRTWQENSGAGEIEPVAKAIARLSGMLLEAGKEAYKSV